MNPLNSIQGFFRRARAAGSAAAAFAKEYGLEPRTPEVADLRDRILREVSAQVRFDGRNRVFVANRLHVTLFPVSDQQRQALEHTLGEGDALELDIRNRLEREHCRFPTDLRVEVEVESPDSEAPPDRFRIRYRTEAASPAERRGKAAAPLVLRVVEGDAEPSLLSLRQGTLHLGRMREVPLSGGDHRRNDLAFSEDKNGINEHVSRRHARIESEERGWRLLADPEGEGRTQIVRNGRDIRVGQAGGVLLREGDEIRLGPARIQVEKASPQ